MWKSNFVCQSSNRILRSGLFFLGFLDLGHYNSLSFEKCHYNSSIRRSAIIISSLPDSCHFLRLQCTKAHWSGMYVYRIAYGRLSRLLLRQTRPLFTCAVLLLARRPLHAALQGRVSRHVFPKGSSPELVVDLANEQVRQEADRRGRAAPARSRTTTACVRGRPTVTCHPRLWPPKPNSGASLHGARYPLHEAPRHTTPMQQQVTNGSRISTSSCNSRSTTSQGARSRSWSSAWWPIRTSVPSPSFSTTACLCARGGGGGGSSCTLPYAAAHTRRAHTPIHDGSRGQQ